MALPFVFGLALVCAAAAALLVASSGNRLRPPLAATARIGALASPTLMVLALLSGPAELGSARGSGSALLRYSPAAGFWLLLAAAFLAARAPTRSAPTKEGRLLARLPSLAALLAAFALGAAGRLERFSPWMELLSQGPRFRDELLRHVGLSLGAFGLALVLGILAALPLSRGGGMGRALGSLAAAAQNIPSLALFGLLLPALSALSMAFPILRRWGISGIGTAPALVALTLYALLPIMLSAAAGLRMVDPGSLDAARGMGMGRARIVLEIELPLALPSIAAGARTALVQTIGTTTVAALVGAGGMGYFVFQGLGQAAMDMVLLGVLPVALLSILADRAMAALVARLGPRAGNRRGGADGFD